MKQFKPNYIIIPALMIFIAGIGRYFSEIGMGWYETLNLPRVIPPGWVYGIVWNILYILLAIVMIWLCNYAKRNAEWFFAMGVLVVNLIGNSLWCYLFFYKQMIFAGFVDCIVVLISAIILMLLVARQSIRMSLLLVPYIVWMVLASYQNYLIWLINT